jgi:hypothetical protein
MSEEQRSILDLHIRAKQQELRARLDDASAAYRLKEELSKDENISAGSNPGVDALFVQLALLDLPKSAAMELLRSDDQRARGLLDNPTAALKIAGQRLFHSYSAALHTVVCEKAGRPASAGALGYFCRERSWDHHRSFHCDRRLHDGRPACSVTASGNHRSSYCQ